ncbi:hypothetical protein I6A60_37330 [Frankia sp. AgB1.9]|uniref:hypothetical protein n=1 Tax=unclassified Frankia TaxID=2632575 RepID=UPI0019324766|nr:MULTISPECIES: hypothetical protein [unclassified Frankia]MBL7493543.1 hypothetical protein [Frankia sp. AgW1.1]MBL7553465.1 hypothetical protein [Frankia sp. AgB1.9]MBL7622318.1 hypothetical protein [Frankia sp. AgB1.8]
MSGVLAAYRVPGAGLEVRPEVLLRARLARASAAAVPRVVIHHHIFPFHGKIYWLYAVSMTSARHLAVWAAQASAFLQIDWVVFVGEPARDRRTRQSFGSGGTP